MCFSFNIFLASASPRRSDILKQFKISFSLAVPSIEIDEVFIDNNPEQTVAENAYKKSITSVNEYKKTGLFLGFDTIVTIGGKILGKPTSKNDAIFMLQTLNGKKHFVYTGVCGINSQKNQILQEIACTEVTFRQLSKQEINNYITSGESMDKAGAYGIQGLGGSLIEKINGCYYNVVGLPVKETLKIINKYEN